MAGSSFSLLLGFEGPWLRYPDHEWTMGAVIRALCSMMYRKKTGLLRDEGAYGYKGRLIKIGTYFWSGRCFQVSSIDLNGAFIVGPMVMD